ncbi:hypothetical protein GCM10009691_40030 [Brevibacterium picturae]|uniref:Uncharacterized protein n=1 Tax=Brevibacterium picturae TaxID=260553 RepID=A0ABN2CRY6_9MICO
MSLAPERAGTEEQCGFAPILARTRTVHSSVGPVAYDCVKVIVVRSGSAILFSEFGEKPVNVSDAVILGANVLCGSEPEGHITVTTIYLDTDYVIDQVFWQHAGLLQDRLEAQGLAETIYSEPAQILRLGEDRAGMLMPWLDELVERSIDGGFARSFYRIQAVWPIKACQGGGRQRRPIGLVSGSCRVDSQVLRIGSCGDWPGRCPWLG